MKKFILIGFLLCLSVNSMVAQSMATMMSYNMKGHSIDDRKAADIAKVINSLMPDVVSVQEVDMRPFIFQHNYLEDIAKATNMYYEFLPTVSNTYGVGLLSRTKPLSVQTKIIPLSDASKDRENRGMIIAEFADYFFIATHYSLNANDRDTATDFILRFTDESQKTVFVAGDFNAEPTYRAMVTFKNYGYKILNNTSVSTFPSDKPTACIDMIISYSEFPEAKKYRVLSSGIVENSEVNLVNISDHLPVFVKLRSISTGLEEEVSERISVVSEEDGIRISGLVKPSFVSIYRINGNVVKQQIVENNGLVHLPSDYKKEMYIVTFNNGLLSHSIKLMFNN